MQLDSPDWPGWPSGWKIGGIRPGRTSNATIDLARSFSARYPVAVRDPRTLVFDLDGTLSDPSVGIARCASHALTRHGHPPIDEVGVRRFIGPPLDEMFLALTGRTDVTPLITAFRERYRDVGYRENQLYPGIPEALAALAARGVRLGVCTSKRVDFAEQVLDFFELRSHFSFVSGGDVGVPKVRQLAALVADGTVGPRSTMIGDRAVDVLAGRGNGLATVGVLWGHGSREELVEAGADRLWSTPGEIDGAE